MKILFVAYGDFYCNSSIHVFGFANQLVRMGHACVVAVPKNKESVSNLGVPLFAIATFDEINAGAALFDNAPGSGPDIIHCWTPREIVRKFAEPLRAKWRCKLVVHLEDNEEHLTAAFLNMTPADALRLDPVELTKRLPVGLSHPVFSTKFIASADGVSVIMDRLKESVPATMPVEIIWPGVDCERFKPLAEQVREREFPGLEPGDHVLAYTGNVHWANREEVRALYQALGALNARGVSTKLLRTGEDQCSFLSPSEEWVRRYELKLGRVDWTAIPRILNAADVLVQPGWDNAFNAFRLPSKLPEFFALAKPVLLPRTNLGRLMADGGSAIVLQSGCADEIAACLEILFGAPELCAQLGGEARAFARTFFAWERSGALLERLYRRIRGEAVDTGACNPSEPTAGKSPITEAVSAQLARLNDARWPAIIAWLHATEERLATMSAEGAAAKADFERRLFDARKTLSWRLMRFMRRTVHLLWRREDGGIAGFLKWLFRRPGAPAKSFDPFEGATIHDWPPHEK